MREKVIIPLMTGLLFLSFSTVAWAQKSALQECQNNLTTCASSLNTCTTNLGTCTNSLDTCTISLTTVQTNYGICTHSLDTCTTGLAGAQTNIATAQTNLATCQATLSQCIQQTPLSSFPSWDKKFACDSTSNCPRFEVLADWANEAVLDRETGLVWEQSPSADLLKWYNAQHYCNDMSKGGRKGWRLPTIQELASLVDPTMISPALPSGHPFSNVQSSSYWSATTVAPDNPATSVAWGVSFISGSMVDHGKGSDEGIHAWCVRGNQGPDTQ